jgi:hypothetical protein
MNLIQPLVIVAVILSSLAAIVILFYRLKFIKQYGLTLWGVSLLLNLIFPMLAEGSHLLLPQIAQSVCFSIFTNTLLLIDFSIVLLLFNRFRPIDYRFLVGILVVFLAIWLVEFAQKGVAEEFKQTTVFMEVIIVALVWVYLFDLYSKPNVPYVQIPFFWIALGWLSANTISSVLSIPQLAAKTSEENQNVLTIITGLSQIAASVFYCIGFWKTKTQAENQITEGLTQRI